MAKPRGPALAILILLPALCALSRAGLALASLPLTFEENRGQSPQAVLFQSRNQGYTLFLTQDEAVVAFEGATRAAAALPAPLRLLDFRGAGAKKIPPSREPGAALRLRWVGARSPLRAEGARPSGGLSHYFLGRDSRRWIKGVRHYAEVDLAGVYPGMDLAYHEAGSGALEFDWRLAAGADPGLIALAVSRAQSLGLGAEGGVRIQVSEGRTLALKAPRAWQESGGARIPVEVAYNLDAQGNVRFKVGPHDRTLPLVIDPVLDYSTYLGEANFGAAGLAVDGLGEAVVTGATSFASFPLEDPLQSGLSNPSQVVFVSKLAAGGGSLVYSTFVGGSASFIGDEGMAVAVDASGAAYVAGFTNSPDFPVVGPFEDACGSCGSAAAPFIFKISPAGDALVYSSYFGGSSGGQAYGVAVDLSACAYVTGFTLSPDFPLVSPLLPAKPASSGQTAFLAKVDAAGDTLVYATFLGGSCNDAGQGVAVDAQGEACVTGGTCSKDFPLANAFDGTFKSSDETGFAAKLNAQGTSLLYSSFLGGSGAMDEGSAVAEDAQGDAYLAGTTQSQDFPTLAAFQPALSGGQSAFVAKLDPGGALVYGSFLGGGVASQAAAIAVDPSGDAYVTGGMDEPSTDYPLALPLETAGTCFVSAFNASGSALLFSTYFGGSGLDAGSGVAADAFGDCWVAGSTGSQDFPLVNPLQGSLSGSTDPFVALIHDDGLPETLTPNWTPTPVYSPTPSSTASPSLTPSPILSPTPSFSLSPTFTQGPSQSATATPASSPSPTASSTSGFQASPSPTLQAEGPPSILSAAFLPDPNPTAVAVLLSGEADTLEVKLYTRAFVRIPTESVRGAFGPGWVKVPLAAGWSRGLARGIYFAVVRASLHGRQGQGPGPLKLALLP